MAIQRYPVASSWQPTSAIEFFSSQNGGDQRAAGVDSPLSRTSPPPLRCIAWFRSLVNWRVAYGEVLRNHGLIVYQGDRPDCWQNVVLNGHGELKVDGMGAFASVLHQLISGDADFRIDSVFISYLQSVNRERGCQEQYHKFILVGARPGSNNFSAAQ